MKPADFGIKLTINLPLSVPGGKEGDVKMLPRDEESSALFLPP